MCSLDKGKEDKVNLKCSDNDQQWRVGGGVGVRAEAWWASRGGSSDERQAREGGRGGREVRSVKPVLNWANVCSPNILRTLRRTMIRFLSELLVRRTWFGQFEEFTCSQMACNEMQSSARTCGRRATDSMIENVG